MKSIVILTDSICKIGGIESLIYIKANYWTNIKDYKVNIITTEQQGRKSLFEMEATIGLHDLGTNFDRNSSYFGPKNLLKVFKNYVRLQNHLDRLNPDIIIIANHIPVTFFFPLLRTSAKIVKEFHFSKFYITKRKKTLFKKYESYLEKKLDHIVVLNEEERAFYTTPNVVVIPNPIISYGNASEVKKRQPIAMAAGRIAPIKRFDVLLDIWSKFVKENKEWKLRIYGSGETAYVQNLKQQINTLQLNDRVELMGSVTNMQEIMQTGSLYLMTSAQECFPMVLLEAQDAGLPIISFDCPTGPRNIISHMHNGILVSNDNQAEFVEQLKLVTSNEDLRTTLATNGISSSQKYTVEKIMKIWDREIINS